MPRLANVPSRGRESVKSFFNQVNLYCSEKKCCVWIRVEVLASDLALTWKLYFAKELTRPLKGKEKHSGLTIGAKTMPNATQLFYHNHCSSVILKLIIVMWSHMVQSKSIFYLAFNFIGCTQAIVDTRV